MKPPLLEFGEKFLIHPLAVLCGLGHLLIPLFHVENLGIQRISKVGEQFLALAGKLSGGRMEGGREWNGSDIRSKDTRKGKKGKQDGKLSQIISGKDKKLKVDDFDGWTKLQL